MAYGGGTFTVQNKVLPGTYINFVSGRYSADIFGDRGTAAIALELDWGEENKIMTVTSGDFQTNSQAVFGYDYTSEKLKGLRDIFLNAKTLYVYRLNGNGAKKAENTFATAKFGGTRGNALKISIAENDGGFDVTTYLEDMAVDKQTVTEASELEDNEFVVFKKEAELSETAMTPLEGGENGSVSNAVHSAFLGLLESYTFNALGLVSTDEQLKSLYAAYTRRLRDEVGLKFQTVLYDYAAADYEGIISVKNKCTDDEPALVYWVTGAAAGCEVNKSNLAKIYNGEFEVEADFTNAQAEELIRDGQFALHRVNEDLRVLADINTLVTTSDTKGDDFKQNQTIRVCDQIAMDIAAIFNTRYLGTVPNDKAGRASLWNDIAKHHRQLESLRAIEDFDTEMLSVEQGSTKSSVVVNDAVMPVNAMAVLYMTVTVN